MLLAILNLHAIYGFLELISVNMYYFISSSQQPCEIAIVFNSLLKRTWNSDGIIK